MSRTMCSILDSMRDAVKTLNFSYMLGLVEEAQTTANRMEAALSDRKDCIQYANYRTQLKNELYELYKVYVEKCAELKVKPKKRDGWLGSRFNALDKKIDKFFEEE